MAWTSCQRARCGDCCCTCATAGKCIVISSHIMQEVEQLADEIVIVAHGRTVAHGTAQAIRAEAGTESLEDAFVKLAYDEQAAAALERHV